MNNADPITLEYLSKAGFKFLNDFDTLRFEAQGNEGKLITVDIVASDVSDNGTVQGISLYVNKGWVALPHIKTIGQLKMLCESLMGFTLPL